MNQNPDPNPSRKWNQNSNKDFGGLLSPSVQKKALKEGTSTSEPGGGPGLLVVKMNVAAVPGKKGMGKNWPTAVERFAVPVICFRKRDFNVHWPVIKFFEPQWGIFLPNLRLKNIANLILFIFNFQNLAFTRVSNKCPKPKTTTPNTEKSCFYPVGVCNNKTVCINSLHLNLHCNCINRIKR